MILLLRVINLLIVVLMWFGPAIAAVHTAESCLQEHVEAAITAAGNGDTVVVPSGTCDWSGLSVTKGIQLVGSGIGSTIITAPSGSASAISASATSDLPVRISGMTIDCTNSTNAWGAVQVSCATGERCLGNRIDSLRFSGATQAASRLLAVFGAFYGVIESLQFTGYGGYQDISWIADGKASWDLPISLGSEYALYIEDSTFEHTTDRSDGVMDAYHGARIVFRYNTVTGSDIGFHGLDSGDYYSTFSYEIYNNSWSRTGGSNVRAANFRGGTGVVYGNRYTGNWFSGIDLQSYRSSECAEEHASITLDRCDSTVDKMCNARPKPCSTSSDCVGGYGECVTPVDGQQDETGYPCRNQIGRTSDTDSDGIDDLRPLYAWDNIILPSTPVTLSAEACASLHIIENRDFYNTQDLTYLPYTYPHPLRGTYASLGTGSKSRLSPGSSRMGAGSGRWQ